MTIFKRRCSFCRKAEDKISKLVAGPRTFFVVGPRIHICDRCIAVASSIVEGVPPPATAR